MTLWQADDAHAAQQHVEQVWFAGVHANVGGGYPDCGLSDTALWWMAVKAREAGLELTHLSRTPAQRDGAHERTATRTSVKDGSSSG